MIEVAGPFEILNPRLLLLFGAVSLAIGASLVLSLYFDTTTKNSKYIDMTNRERYIISGTIAISAVTFALERDGVLQIYGWLSLVLIILLPISTTVFVIKMLIE